MATTQTEDEERTELIARLGDLLDDEFAQRYLKAPMHNLRHAVESCEAQLAFYARCGFEDMAART